MKKIKQLTKKIDDQLATIVRLGAEVERVEQRKRAAQENDCGLEALRDRRKAALVDAYLKGRKLDATEIDSEIAAAEKLRSANSESAEAALGALDVLRSAWESAHDELATLESERNEAVKEHIVSQHDDAQKRYLDAVEAMREPVEQMIAAERAWRLCVDAGVVFPAYGAKVLADIRNKGVRVTWEHSTLRDPKVSTGYTDNYRNFWYVPAWADLRNTVFGDAQTDRLIGEIRSCGVTVANEAREPALIAERQVEVEIIRGSFIDATDVRRDPETGSVVSKVETRRVIGDRFKIAESEVKSLVATGSVRLASEIDAERLRLREEQFKTSGVASVNYFETKRIVE